MYHIMNRGVEYVMDYVMYYVIPSSHPQQRDEELKIQH